MEIVDYMKDVLSEDEYFWNYFEPLNYGSVEKVFEDEGFQVECFICNTDLTSSGLSESEAFERLKEHLDFHRWEIVLGELREII